MDWTILTPRKVVFGWGRRHEVADLARAMGRRAWIVCGSRTLVQQGVLAELQGRLESAGIRAPLLTTATREPEVADVDAAVADLHSAGLADGDFVIGMGGGAGLDLAKAVAARATNLRGESVRDYLEGVGSGLTIDVDPLPLLAIPTTAGTGTEATKNAVISSFDPPFKKSLRSERMVPDLVLVDPELTVSCPPEVTAPSGMDAITQLIESYLSCRATPFTRAIALDAVCEVLGQDGGPPAIVTAVTSPGDQTARERMSFAALMSGMALANSGLGLAHGVAAALGVHCRVSHGLACAVLLPIALRANQHVCEQDLRTLGRRMSLDADEHELSSAVIARIESINEQVGIPVRLGALGVGEDQIPAIVASSHGNSLSGNPRVIDDEELAGILRSNL